MSRLTTTLVIAAAAVGLHAAVPSMEAASPLPAFPGAEGFGASSVGGRGGKVIKVTNLNDSGPGSFRDAVTASGPRIVVFDVSGTIVLTSLLQIQNGYLTIAGQTSPGGIAITQNKTTTGMKDIQIIAPHVIVQHVRFRNSTGDHGLVIAGANDGSYPYDAHDVIIDHCSFSWGRDENVSVVYGAYNVTIQWSLVSQGIVSHSKGILVSGKKSAKPSTVSIHHNYLAHNQDRNPMIGVGELKDTDLIQSPPVADVVNNVVFHWEGGMVAQTVGRAFVNWVHNYLKPASTYRASHPASDTPIATHQRLTTWPDVPQTYVEGNISGMRPDQTHPDWVVGDYFYTPSPNHPLLGEEIRTKTRHPAPPITTMTASADMAATILKTVGATVPVRDSHDAQMVEDFSANGGLGGGVMISSVTYPTDWPTYANLKPPVDTDNDGMPDVWELAHGLNPAADDSAGDGDSDGYTNIEEYLHHLSTGGAGAPRAPGNVHIK